MLYKTLYHVHSNLKCYLNNYCKFISRAFNVINPTNEAYEFIFEMVISDKPELVPVHCNMLKGFVDGGTSTEVEFTFSPTAPGVRIIYDKISYKL